MKSWKGTLHTASKPNANCSLQRKGETSTGAAVHLLISRQGFVFMTRIKPNNCSRSNTSSTVLFSLPAIRSTSPLAPLWHQSWLGRSHSALLKAAHSKHFRLSWTSAPLTLPHNISHTLPLAVSIQHCSVTRDTSRDHHGFSGKVTQYPWNVIRESQGDLILLRFYSKTVFSPGTNTLHLINKIKIQISQRNSYDKHFHKVHNDKRQSPICWRGTAEEQVTLFLASA